MAAPRRPEVRSTLRDLAAEIRQHTPHGGRGTGRQRQDHAARELARAPAGVGWGSGVARSFAPAHRCVELRGRSARRTGRRGRRLRRRDRAHPRASLRRRRRLAPAGPRVPARLVRGWAPTPTRRPRCAAWWTTSTRSPPRPPPIAFSPSCCARPCRGCTSFSPAANPADRRVAAARGRRSAGSRRRRSLPPVRAGGRAAAQARARHRRCRGDAPAGRDRRMGDGPDPGRPRARATAARGARAVRGGSLAPPRSVRVTSPTKCSRASPPSSCTWSSAPRCSGAAAFATCARSAATRRQADWIELAVDHGILQAEGTDVWPHRLWQDLLRARLRDRSDGQAWRDLHRRVATTLSAVGAP